MIKYILTILYLLQSTDTIPAKRPNKLISYDLPKNRSVKRPAGYIEDIYLNFTQLTTKYGYPSEEHTVTTEDGYILTVFRILPKCPLAQGFPVILGHGIVDSSDTWIVTGPETGLGYILANNCYNVWAVNFRGNVYSRKHIRLDPDKDPAYWNFSFDENGNYDLPAVIDYVLDVTGQRKVYYIGHSQGSTNFFVMGSLKPEYNEKVHLSIQLGPVAWLKNIKSPFPKILAPHSKEIKRALEYMGFNELLAKHQLTHLLAEIICQIAPNEICGILLALGTGYTVGTITSTNLAVAFGHVIVGVSLKNVAHFGQLVNSGQFRRYDEGKSENIRKYGSTKPPKYDLSLVTSPIVLINAKNDLISTLEDIDILTSKLPNLIDSYVVPESGWSHNNHVWGVNASELVFEKILHYFQTYS